MKDAIRWLMIFNISLIILTATTFIITRNGLSFLLLLFLGTGTYRDDDSNKD